MGSTRLMPGIVDFSGSRVNSMIVGEMVSRYPEPRYAVACDICDVKTTSSQSAIRNRTLRCRNSACGKTEVKKRLADDRRNAHQDAESLRRSLEAEARRAMLAQSTARMEAETEGYTVPASRPSHPVPTGPMSERDRIALRAHRNEVEAASRAEREAREAPIRAAEAALKETHRELARVMRERLFAEVRDFDAFIDPAVARVRMTEEQAADYNKQQFRIYREQHPDIYWTEELVDQVGRYFDKNNLKIISAAMIENVVERFGEAGLLPERPEDDAPTTVDEIEPQVIEPAEPELIDGWDIESGEPRKWTARALDRLSSTDYRRALHLDKAALSLPNIGPGPDRPPKN